MIISLITILFLIVLHLFPKRIREKVLYRFKRILAGIRKIFKRKKKASPIDQQS